VSGGQAGTGRSREGGAAPRVGHVNLARGYRGGERQTELLIRELSRCGVDQHLWTRAGSPLADRLDGLERLVVERLHRPFALRALRRPPAELLHAHDGHAVHLAHLIGLRAGMPYLVTRRVPNRPSHHPATRRAYRHASRVVVLSDAIGESLRAYDPEIRTSLIPSAAAEPWSDPAAVRRLRERYRGRFVVGQIGALDDRHKGQSLLIEAARRLAPRIPELRVVLIGAGPDEHWLRQASADLDPVELSGWVDDVGDYLRALDVLAMPSREEGLGSALLEAMAAGVPVIAARTGGIPEIVRHEDTGLLVEPGDAAGLAAGIERLHRAPDLRERLAATALREMAAYTPAVMAERYLELYRAVV